MTTYEVKCATCNVPLQGPADPQPHDTLSCPTCGQGDILENVNREIGEYVTEKATSALGIMMADTFRNSSSIKVTKNYQPKGSYRFIVDYEPPV